MADQAQSEKNRKEVGPPIQLDKEEKAGPHGQGGPKPAGPERETPTGHEAQHPGGAMKK